MRQYEIRKKYIDMVSRYKETKGQIDKIQKKYKFMAWFSSHRDNLTDAEKEYLQESICYVPIDYY